MSTIGTRYVPFISLSPSGPKSHAIITLAGCNFRCRGCFSSARQLIGQPMSVDELVKLIEMSCDCYQVSPEKVKITGGEPTLNKEFLIALVQKLKEHGYGDLLLSTNGSLLDREYVTDLKDAGLTEVALDMKAYTNSIHQWYTGRSNHAVLMAAKNLWECGLDFHVETVLRPGIVDCEEIEHIAAFLARIDRGIRYKITKFGAEYAKEKIARRPTDKEVQHAVACALQHLKTVTGGLACSEQHESSQKTFGALIRVYPAMDVVVYYPRPRTLEG
jgi:pyruvate formate lyase activating enzyme